MTEHGEFVMQGHLGGYVAGGDPDCMYSEMWAWVVEHEHVGSVLDVGCGDGAAMDVFQALGCDVLGLDGVAQENPLIVPHDFTLGPTGMKPDATFDMVWSCEFVEHVEERFLDNIMDALTRAPLVLMTHAVPGQPGYHHVNCQESEYWQRRFALQGYDVDWPLTARCRELAHGYFAATGLAVRRAA